jgi:hypothetical protein
MGIILAVAAIGSSVDRRWLANAVALLLYHFLWVAKVLLRTFFSSLRRRQSSSIHLLSSVFLVFRVEQQQLGQACGAVHSFFTASTNDRCGRGWKKYKGTERKRDKIKGGREWKKKRKKRSFTSEAAFADDTPPPRLRDERKMKKSPFFLLPLSAIAEGEKNRPMERQKARGLRHERSGLAKDRRTDELSEEFLTRRRRSFSCQARYSNQLLHLLSRSPALAGALPLFFSPFTHTHTHTFCSCYGLLNSQIYLAPFFFLSFMLKFDCMFVHASTPAARGSYRAILSKKIRHSIRTMYALSLTHALLRIWRRISW